MGTKNKLIFLPRYAEYGASSRYRSYQIARLFREKEDFEIIIRPFFSRKKYRFIFYPYYVLRRLLVLALNSKSLYYVQADLFPYLPINIFQPKRYVLDYDDAVWVSEKVKCDYLVHSKYSELQRRAQHIIVGSRYLKDYLIEKFGAPKNKVTIIPTTFSITKYGSPFLSEKDNDICFGWIGSPSTSPFLDKILDLFADNQGFGVKFMTLGYQGRHSGQQYPWWENRQWSDLAELDFMRKVSVGIAPVIDTPFSRGKCGFKVVQYLAMGLAVAGNDAPSNRAFINDKTGLLIQSDSDWIELFRNPSSLKGFGVHNSMWFEKELSLEVQFEKYKEIVSVGMRM